jgi:parallel beta-helix repeat protein
LELNNCSYIVFEGITFTNAMWGIYVKSSEHIIIKGNEIYNTGQEGCHIGGSSKYVDVIGNKIHDIHPGTAEQYNQAAITVEGSENSIKNNYRLSENRDIWVENNTIENVSGGYSDWNNGIMFFGTGVYILNNTVKNCANIGIYGNNWKNLGLQNFVYGNTISNCGTNMVIYSDVKVSESNPGKNPHSPQKWNTGF